MIFNDEVPVDILDDWDDEYVCGLWWAIVGPVEPVSAKEVVRVWAG